MTPDHGTAQEPPCREQLAGELCDDRLHALVVLHEVCSLQHKQEGWCTARKLRQGLQACSCLPELCYSSATVLRMAASALRLRTWTTLVAQSLREPVHWSLRHISQHRSA